jgi:uncharacterized membrane protein HdeD (DUF308 family)
MKKGSALFWGLILIAIGVIFLIHNFTDIDVWDYVWKWWPILLIVMGFHKLVQYFTVKE